MDRPFRLLNLILAVASATAAADHVVILGFDGMSPNGVQTVATPILHDMMGRGA